MNDLENNKVLIEIEFYLLSIFMCSDVAKGKILSKLIHSDFLDKKHQLVYKNVLELYKKGINVDAITLVNHLQKNNLLNNVGGREFILSLYAQYTGDTYLENYLNMIVENSNLTKLKKMLISIRSDIDSNSKESTELIKNVDKKLQEIIVSGKEDSLKKINKISNVVYENIRKLSISNYSYNGLTSGYSSLDRMTTGFQKGDLIILAARPSIGKTAFALNMALRIAKQKKTVAIFSLEMPSDQLVSRIYSMNSHVDLKKIRSGKDITSLEWQKIENAKKITSSLKIYLDDSSNLDMITLQLKIKQILFESNNSLELVIIDYLQLITSSNNKFESRQQEISKLSRQLKIISRQLNIPIICLSQLSRNVERRENKRPIMSDLRESGSIEQDADLIILMYRENYYLVNDAVKYDQNDINNNLNQAEQVEIILSKNRNGPTGKIILDFIKNNGIFIESEKKEV